MNLKKLENNVVHVSLSRRNLETLIKMLDQKVGMPVLHRKVSDGDDGEILIVKAEENETHYASEDRQERLRGQMGVGPDDVKIGGLL